ncbi:MAG: DUF2304 family protein [Candidatus Eisenbacteria bacterium]|nr:DUF2304 family protein [Candidatus Eisenbacteria bacterium]
MEPQARLFVVLLCLLVVLVVARQLRRWNLGLGMSLLWLAVAVGGLLLTVAQSLADRVSHWIGIHYPPALFFLVSLVGGLLILLRLSINLARLESQNRRLAQEIALLRRELAGRAAERDREVE